MSFQLKSTDPRTVLFWMFILSAFILCSQTEKTYLFVGSYTGGKADKGIYVFEFNSVTGEMMKVSTGVDLVNPSYLAVSHHGKFVFACTETKTKNAGSVSVFKFDSIKGSLSFLKKQNSGGENPVYLATSLDDHYLINANYTEGTITVFRIDLAGDMSSYLHRIQYTGSGKIASRQDKSHVHAVVFSPDHKYLFIPDLGADKIRVCRFDTSRIDPLEPLTDHDIVTIPGSGPRHLVFHPTKAFAYCTEELSGTISAFKYENGNLDSIQRIFSYSKIQDQYSGADIHISPDGLFLYATNRLDNENTISIFSINTDGKLKLIGHQFTYGDNPRSFVIDPTGNFLIVANQITNNIVVFKRDQKTGLLSNTGHQVNLPEPSCLKMQQYQR